MQSIEARRLDRSLRKATDRAIEAGQSLDNLPTAEEALAAAEAASRSDRFALAGIGRHDPLAMASKV